MSTLSYTVPVGGLATVAVNQQTGDTVVSTPVGGTFSGPMTIEYDPSLTTAAVSNTIAALTALLSSLV